VYILGIETSTQICGAALVNANTWLAHNQTNLKNMHASILVDLINAVLRQAAMSATDLAAIAVSIGPGSFTGLRIGLSVAKGIALGANVPIVTVPTLDALAFHAPVRDGTVAAVLKSRADEYYYAQYKRRNFCNELLLTPQILKTAEILAALPNDSLLIGHTADFQNHAALRDRIYFAPAASAAASALSVALLGRQKFMDDELAEYETVEPMYFQDFIAGKPKQH
jgi:tRNA threonylcarbamoyladenosine biosynthesis protein TsaB